MSGYSKEDLDALQKYADQMQALPNTPPVYPAAPADADIQSLRDYADQMQQLPNTPNVYPASQDAQPDNAGPIAATAIEAQRPVAPGATAIEGQQRQAPPPPQGRAVLGFALPAGVVDAANSAKAGGEQLMRGAQSFASHPGDLPRAATQQAQHLGDLATQYAKKVDLPLGVGGGAGLLLKNRDTTDIGKRKEDAEKTKEVETAAAQSGTPVDQQAQDVAAGRAPPQAYVTPERWVRTNSPEARALEEELYGEGRKREMQDEEINERLFNQKRIEAAGDQAGRDYAQQERARLNVERSQRIMQQHQGDLDAANKAYMSAKVDPDRFFKNRGTASNVASAIGVALGAFGASLTHSPNFALDIVNKAVDNDIEAQKAEIAKRGQNANNMLAKLKDSTGNYESAENMYRIAALQYAKSKADEMGAQGTDVALQKQLSDEIEKHTASHLNYVDAHTAHILPQVVGGGGGISEKDQANIFRAPDGTMYKARNPESYKKLTEGSDLYRGLSSDFADYQAALSKLGPLDRMSLKTGTPTESASRAMTIYTNMMGKIRQGNDDGVWKKSETEMLANTVAPPDHLTGNASSQVGAAKKHLDNMWNGTIKTHDPLPVQTGYKYDATGHLAPTAGYTGQQAQGVREMPKKFKDD